jgi:hypothetical protein
MWLWCRRVQAEARYALKKRISLLKVSSGWCVPVGKSQKKRLGSSFGPVHFRIQKLAHLTWLPSPLLHVPLSTLKSEK